jgi:hypothetical protein
MSVPGLEHLPGTALPEGGFTITEEEDRQVLDVVGGDPAADGTAHPLWAYIATQRGIGISVADLCALADFDVNDGPMLGSTDLEYAGKLRIGVPYRVTGEVIDIARKAGRSGTFDVMTFRERLVGEDGEAVASSTSTFILPRKGK